MLSFKSNFLLLIYLSSGLTKVTYFNLENTYGPYCNKNNVFTPDAGIIRYAGTPWVGKCTLNIRSCCLPTFLNGSLVPNLPVSTKFYLYLVAPPLCATENVTVLAGSGEVIHIDCQTDIGSEYYFDTETITFIYEREEKMPMSKFLMVLTPLKMKTRIYTTCGFDCFSETHCIDRTLVCDRFRNCPNGVDEEHCEYHQQHEALSLRARIILLIGLCIIISIAISSILICYFCCESTHCRNLRLSNKEAKSAHAILEETGTVNTHLLSSSIPNDH